MTTDRPSETSTASSPPPRPHRKRGASSLPYLFFLALFFLVQAFSSSFRELVERGLGVERTLLFGIGFLCLHSAWLAFDTTRLRERLLDLLAETMKALRGANAGGAAPPAPPNDPTAIEILVKAMGSANVESRQSARAHLVRLTGQDFGDDADRWATWFASQRRGGTAQNSGDAK